MPFDAFIKIDGAPGAATDAKHKDWIDVLSFKWGMAFPTQVAGMGSGAQAGAGKIQASKVVVVKAIDKSSPILYESCATGKHIKEIKIEFTTGGSRDLKYQTITLKDCVVHSAEQELKGGDVSIHTEQCSFAYSGIQWSVQPVNPKTGMPEGGPVTTGWDFTKMEKI